MDIVLNTGSTVLQAAAVKGGIAFGEGYAKEAAYCNINPEDFVALGKPWFVRVTNQYGDSVVVRAKKANAQQKGEVFIPRGIWANIVVTTETESTGSPSYKSLPVKVEKCRGPVMGPVELMKHYYASDHDKTTKYMNKGHGKKEH